ncbi:MAG: alpha/beta hydrolase-fold protein [Bacteroidota bacterium]
MSITIRTTNIAIEQFSHYYFSKHLNRNIRVDIYTPSDYGQNDDRYPIVYFNDGQDLPRIQLVKKLQEQINTGAIPPIIVVGIHANHDRMQEYGVSTQIDYMGRGSRAGLHRRFVIEELLPFIKQHYRVTEYTAQRIFAGFSLGGLTAFDLVWNHADIFGKVGVFSGSFWWRSAPMYAHDPDANRMMHDILYRSHKRDGLQFWLQTGTKDETEDRNNNGIIDSIDDTNDIIRALRYLGYAENDIKYVEVEGGYHHPNTWSKVLPDFLQWAL